MFRVDDVSLEAETLVVRCSGFFRRGSEGNGDAGQLASSIVHWVKGHPATPIKHAVVDFRDVDYVWGDGPVSALVPVIRDYGVSEIRYLASPENRQALEGLIEACNIPWFGLQTHQEG